MSKINIIKIDIEGGEEHIENGLSYISNFPDINLLISLHPPFWSDKNKTANMLIKQFEKYDVFNDNEENISKSELMQKMLDETPTGYRNRTGFDFALILKTKQPNG